MHHAPDIRERMTRVRLPNGLEIWEVNRYETDFFYRQIFERRTELREWLRIRSGDTVVDVGANIGLFTLFAAAAASDVTVHAFEPVPPIFAVLQRNIRRHCADAYAYRVAAGAREERRKMSYFPRSTCQSTFWPAPEDREILEAIVSRELSKSGMAPKEVATTAAAVAAYRLEPVTVEAEVTTLAAWMKRENVDCVDLLKIDVERAEVDVLIGVGDAWPRIGQVVVEAHGEMGNDQAVARTLVQRGFEVNQWQDISVAGTRLCIVAARRPCWRRRVRAT